MTNKEFAENNTYFKELCRRAGCSPSPRQACKYKNKRGQAYAQYLKEKSNAR